MRKRFLVIAITVIAALTIVLAFSISQYLVSTHMYPQDAMHEDSNLAVRGTVASVEENYEAQGLAVTSYHVYRFLIRINITEIVWFGGDMEYYFSENFSDSNSFSIEDKTLNGFKTVGIGYDNPDEPNLQIGQAIECKGYYIGVTDAPGSFLITVSPSINGSYLKPTN
jgi:hypothetical protein